MTAAHEWPGRPCKTPCHVTARSKRLVTSVGAAATARSGAGATGAEQKGAHMRGAGRVGFAGVLLLIAGVINILYGIGANAHASIFVNDTRFVLEDLNALGWVLIILGVIQLTGGFSLLAGHAYGRII